MSSKTPTSKTIHCNSCRRETRHKLVKRIDGDTGVEGDEPQTSIHWQTTFDVLQCNGCLEVTLERIYEFSEWDCPDIRYFPPRISRHLPKWVDDVPYEVKTLLEEIYRTLDANNYRLPLMGTRTLVDMVMLEKVGDGGLAHPFIDLKYSP